MTIGTDPADNCLVSAELAWTHRLEVWLACPASSLVASSEIYQENQTTYISNLEDIGSVWSNPTWPRHL